jgi:ABC-type nitrate/sulfonate/bicarbonate transport system ATPase subunit
MPSNANDLAVADATAATGHTDADFLKVRNICKSFRSGRGDRTVALDDVSLTIRKNEFISIIGPSGCGKTTLLRLIAGLDRPDSGEIVVGAKPVTKPAPDRAVVFQQPALLPWASVLDNVALGLRMRGVPKAERNSQAAVALAGVGLSGFERHIPRELSGGMQQRVALARASVLNPAVLLMDEPYASLDEITRRKLHRELLSLYSRDPRTCVFITHNVNEAVILADRVVVMSPRPGRVSEIVDVPLPRPRTLEHEQSPALLEARAHIWKRIEEWDT